MAMTPTEKQRRYRARLKEKQIEQPEATRGLSAVPFFKAFHKDGNAGIVQLALDVIGVDPDLFKDDSDPKPFNHDTEFDYGRFPGSIGRAELYVSFWMEAAQGLASMINRYKTEAVENALANLEQADLTDPAVRKKAMAEIVRLNKIRDRLKTTGRLIFDTYEVKGI